MVRFLNVEMGWFLTIESPSHWRDHTLSPGRVMEFEVVVQRVRAEFLEMPDLTLTISQAQRLLGLEEELCRRVIAALIGTDFLRCGPDGTIARAGV
jgi:hypothetical protein